MTEPTTPTPPSTHTQAKPRRMTVFEREDAHHRRNEMGLRSNKVKVLPTWHRRAT